MRICRVVGVWAILVGSLGAGEQESWLVFDKGCLTDVRITQNTVLRFPMVNGEPDRKKAIVTGVEITYVPSCGHFETERKK